MSLLKSWTTPSPTGTRWRDFSLPAGCLLTLVFLGYFWRFPEFGFYGDDAGFFGGTINRSWSAEWQHVWFCLTRWPQGRPLGMGVNLSLLPHLAYALGGLPMLHLSAFGILGLNTLLIYRLVARAASPFAGFVAAGFFGLAPAHTTQLSLVFGFNYGIAIAVGLGAAHAALSRRWWLYGIGTGMTLTMAEPAAMIAVVVSVGLAFRLPQPDWRRLLWPIVIWLAAVVIVLLVRRQLGDPWGQERVGEIAAAPLQTLLRSIQSATTGPLTNFSLVFERLALPFRELTAELIGIMTGGAVLALIGIRVGLKINPASAKAADAQDTAPQATASRTWASAQLVGVGLLSMAAIYATYFRAPWHPANGTAGFISGVHVVSATGAALVFGGLARLLEQGCLRQWLQLPLAILATVFLVPLVGFGQLVQKDYAAAWRFQRDFWRTYGELCPDAGPGTYTLVLDRNLPAYRFIERNSWTAEFLPDALFPRGSGTGLAPQLRHAPAVIFTAPDPAQAITIRDGISRWKATDYLLMPKTDHEQPVSGHVIVLEHNGQRWRRWVGFLALDGGVLELQNPRSDQPPAGRTRLTEAYGL